MPVNVQASFLVGIQSHVDKNNRSSQRQLWRLQGINSWTFDLTAVYSLLSSEYDNHFTQLLSEVILYWSSLIIFLCSLCFAPCDLWTNQAHTKTKGTSQQMRYRLLCKCAEHSMDYFSIVEHVVTVHMSIFVGRLLTTSKCDLHKDYRMKGSIPTVWQVSWLIMINITLCRQQDMWDLKSSRYSQGPFELSNK